MESQMQRPAHQHIDESNQPGEKKSVLKKVKDKAKKLKDTIKKPAQGQGQEHEYRYDENVDEDDDDDQEEIANDREIHGAAPTHDSTVIKSKNLPMQPDQNVEKPTDTRGDRIDPMVKGEAKARPNIPAQTGYEQENPSENKHFPSPTKPVSVHREENAGEPEVKLGPSMGLEEDQHSTKFRPGDAPVPPSNYESKLSDPTGDGGKEAGVGQLIHGFHHLSVGNESETKQQPEKRPSIGSHDQFNPESDPLTALDNPEPEPKSFDSNTKEGMSRDTITGNVSSATSALSDKAISAKNVVASKLGYGGGSGQEGLSPSNKPESESAPGYTQRITDTLNPVYEKVAGAGTTVMSKFQGGGDAAATGTDKGVSEKDHWAEKLKPGDEDKALSESITDALGKKKDGYSQKRGEEKPIGKVTESEEVAARLGTGIEGKREGEDALDAGRQSSGPGVVGRVKDAVGSWMGKGTGTHSAQDSINESYFDNAGQQPRGQE